MVISQTDSHWLLYKTALITVLYEVILSVFVRNVFGLVLVNDRHLRGYYLLLVLVWLFFAKLVKIVAA